MDKIHKYYGIQAIIEGRWVTVYIAESEVERVKVLNWLFKEDTRICDISRSSKLPEAKKGFQRLEFWYSLKDVKAA
jgi:hypothetical protein